MNGAKILFYAVLFCGGFMAVSLWSFWLAIKPPKIILGRTPADLELSAENITLTADDGTPLAGWFVPDDTPDNAKRAIIFLHGYPAEKSDMLGIAAPFHKNFGIFLLDLRSFGASGGRYTTLGLKEPSDAVKAVDFLQSRGYTSIGMFGFSLGGAAAIRAAEKDSRIEALVSYGAFSDLRTLGYEIYRGLLFLKYPLVGLMEVWARLWFGEWLAGASPLSAAERLQIPILLTHSQRDEQISFSHFERLQRALSQNPRAEFFVIERGLHGELPPDFHTRIQKFFETVL
jgi:dipeptidyl aminopeptidase/acylaminoacyl peptidase